jgi:rubredoxin
MAAHLRCVCGYVYLEEWAREEGHVSGEEPFVYLRVMWHPDADHDERAEVYACPKCGTLKVWVDSDNDDGRRTN